MIRPSDVQEETRRIRALQRVVALALQTLATQVTTRDEAIAVMNGTRDYALRLFPDKADAFDIIYGPRLLRMYRERFDRPGEDQRIRRDSLFGEDVEGTSGPCH